MTDRLLTHINDNEHSDIVFALREKAANDLERSGQLQADAAAGEVHADLAHTYREQARRFLALADTIEQSTLAIVHDETDTP